MYMLCENLGQWLATKDRTEFQYLNKTFSFPTFSVKEASKEARLSLTSKRKLLQLRHRFIFFIFLSMTLAKAFSFVPYSEERLPSWSLYKKDTFLQSSFLPGRKVSHCRPFCPPLPSGEGGWEEKSFLLKAVCRFCFIWQRFRPTFRSAPELILGKLSQNSGKSPQIKNCSQYWRIHPSTLSLSRALDGWRPDWEWQLGSLFLSLRGKTFPLPSPHTFSPRKKAKRVTRKEKTERV